MSQPKRFKRTRIANLEQNVINKVYSEAKKIEFPWNEAAPDIFVAWLETFSRAQNMVKQFELYSELLCKFHDCKPLLVMKGNSKRDGPKETGTAFCGASPNLVLSFIEMFS